MKEEIRLSLLLKMVTNLFERELNNKVATMAKEKEDILAMKVSQLGLKPGESATEEGETNPEGDAVDQTTDIRFSKLHDIDIAFKDYKIQNYNNSFTLPELVELFRNFSASKLKLFYTTEMIRLFISALASTKLVILQGISGTGKTSLAYAWGKFLKHDSCVASVQPSWRDKTELVGYFNEFTKKFNETEVLAELYKASFDDDIHTIILDEMNIARVEYYFAEMLSTYITNTPEQWEAWMETAAGTTSNPKPGRELLEAKLNVVRLYMKNSWNIDIDKLRTSVLRRENDVVAGKINLSDLTIK